MAFVTSGVFEVSGVCAQCGFLPGVGVVLWFRWFVFDVRCFWCGLTILVISFVWGWFNIGFCLVEWFGFWA